jgi:hypothetical protein
MMEFGNHGTLAHLRSEERRALFTDIVPIINRNKVFSVASTLSAANYRKHFDDLTGVSMYGASFVQVAMINGTGFRSVGKKDPIKYRLDDGNSYTLDVVEAHKHLLENEILHPVSMGDLDFDSDHNCAALQAADVVAWSVRRRLASALKSGFEPLANLFHDDHHIEVEYKEEWMKGVADSLRAKRQRTNFALTY